MSDIITPPRAPSSIPDLAVWYDAAQLTGLADDDPIVQVDDFSGNGRHGTQGTPGFRATYKTNILNGLPAMRFDGTDDRYEISNSASVIRNIAGSTIIILARNATDAAAFQYVISFDVGSSTQRHAVGKHNASGGPWSSRNRRLDGESIVNLLTVASASIAAIIGSRHNYTGGTLQLFRNGTVSGTGNFSDSGNNSNTDSENRLGARGSDGSFNNWNGDIFEVGVWPRTLTEAELFGAILHLSQKWDIPVVGVKALQRGGEQFRLDNSFGVV